MELNPKIEAVKQQDESQYERVTHDTPAGEGYLRKTGWTITSTFPNTDVPMILVINQEDKHRIPLDRVQYTEQRDPEESELV